MHDIFFRVMCFFSLAQRTCMIFLVQLCSRNIVFQITLPKSPQESKGVPIRNVSMTSRNAQKMQVNEMHAL